MSPSSTTHPPAPRNHLTYDPWNTGAHGHERPEHIRVTKPKARRNERTTRLRRQYRGLDPLPDSTIAAYEQQQQTRNTGDIREYMCGQRKLSSSSANAKAQHQPALFLSGPPTKKTDDDAATPDEKLPITSTSTSTTATKPKIFTGINVYINGSTGPGISDLRLRKLVAEHGGGVSNGLARCSVTHVVIPSSCSSLPTASTASAGGGGLSAAKLQKEIVNKTGRGGKSIKFVNSNW